MSEIFRMKGVGEYKVYMKMGTHSYSLHTTYAFILLPSAELFKKGCCQLQVKGCAQSTG